MVDTFKDASISEVLNMNWHDVLSVFACMCLSLFLFLLIQPQVLFPLRVSPVFCCRSRMETWSPRKGASRAAMLVALKQGLSWASWGGVGRSGMDILIAESCHEYCIFSCIIHIYIYSL